MATAVSASFVTAMSSTKYWRSTTPDGLAGANRAWIRTESAARMSGPTAAAASALCDSTIGSGKARADALGLPGVGPSSGDGAQLATTLDGTSKLTLSRDTPRYWWAGSGSS